MDTDKIFNLDDEQPMPVCGSLLVARPTVNDPFFGRSVVLMFEHNEKGSAGLTLNNYHGWTLKHQLIDIDCERGVPLYLGGPVGMDQLFYIHTLGPQVLPDAVSLGNGLWLGGDFDALVRYLQGRRPEDGIDGAVKFFLGYSGWESGQLRREIENHDWVVLDDLPVTDIMADDCRGTRLWSLAVSRFGERYRLWNNWPSDPTAN